MTSAPTCPLCARPRRWIERRQDHARYCGGASCTATERPCRTCGNTFIVNAPGTGPHTCSPNCKQPSTNANATHGIPPWEGRRAQQARQTMASRLPEPCGQCGEPVDGTSRWVVGHIKSRQEYPELTWDPTNWRIEHAQCSSRSAAMAQREAGYRDGYARGFTEGYEAARRGDVT